VPDDVPLERDTPASGMLETHAQVVWLEACGWSIGDDGFWRHPLKAPQGVTHSRAFAVQSSYTRFPARPRRPGER
jgi:hypothetical protein